MASSAYPVKSDCLGCEPKSHPVFHILLEEGLDLPLSCSACIRFSKGQEVLTQGSGVKGIYCINSGIVKVHAIGETGKDQIIRFSKAGDVLGFRTLLGEQSLAVSATALSEVSVCYISRENFEKMMDLSSRFRERVLKELSTELSEMVGALTDMAQRSVRSRLCLALIELGKVFDDQPINISREDLSNFVGTATETVIRLLSELKQDELIKVEGRRLVLLDKDRLQKMASYS